jgi:hypothetical protein
VLYFVAAAVVYVAVIHGVRAFTAAVAGGAGFGGGVGGVDVGASVDDAAAAVGDGVDTSAGSVGEDFAGWCTGVLVLGLVVAWWC